ncbi:MAG: hypothetical protein GTO24_04960, partial [candidate division Zixibacteria bacterium]|nr:hypothetical protein [candidate division Zixibacteria bacterium]
MANKKRAAVPKPAVKAKPTEDQLEKARIEKEKQDKLAKMKELYEKGSSLIDIGKLHRIRPHQVRGYLLKGNVKMRTTA